MAYNYQQQQQQQNQILSYPAPSKPTMMMQYPSPQQQQQQPGGYGQPPPPGYGQPMPTPGFNPATAPQQPSPPPSGAPYPVPIMQQPAGNFYPAPMAPQQVPFGPYSNPTVPPGLEVLLTLNQLIIEQQVEMLEAFLGYETNNKYIVKNLNGQHLFYAAEKNDCLTRNFCGADRPFVMKLYDNVRNEILRFDRPLRSSSCLFPCCLQRMDIYSGNGSMLGRIEQEWSLFYPNFHILNGQLEKVLHIQGPLFTSSCFGTDVDFQVLSPDCTTDVGKISKKWSGLAREMFTDADRFGVEFPRDLDVNIKAVLLAATFLIDYMYFENSRSS